MNPKTSVTKIGQNSLYCFLRYGVHKVYGSVPSVTLTFDLLTPKANRHIRKRKYICDQNWVKFPSLVFTVRRKVCKHYIYVLWAAYPSVCPSVRPTLRYCIKTRERRGTRCSLSGSPVSLVFCRRECLMGIIPCR